MGTTEMNWLYQIQGLKYSFPKTGYTLLSQNRTQIIIRMLNNSPHIFKMKNLTILTNCTCRPGSYCVFQIREVYFDFFLDMLQLLNFRTSELTKNCIKVDGIFKAIIGKRDIADEGSIIGGLFCFGISNHIPQSGFKNIIRKRILQTIYLLKKAICSYLDSLVNIGLDGGDGLHICNTQSCTFNPGRIVLLDKHKAPLENTLEYRVDNPNKRCYYWKSKSSRKVDTRGHNCPKIGRLITHPAYSLHLAMQR